MYPYLLVTHLLAAIAFIGTLFFEVLIWSGVRQQLAGTARSTADQAIARRSRKVLHGVVLLLYGAGVGMAWHYRDVLSDPLASRFGTLLSLKILLALSIIGHYLLLARGLKSGRITSARALRIRRSILGHMVSIVILAKAMFFWHG